MNGERIVGFLLRCERSEVWLRVVIVVIVVEGATNAVPTTRFYHPFSRMIP